MSLNLQAKKKTKETNIVCFATQKKWICAPEDQQNVANQKARKLVEKQASEMDSSPVVINTINIPKFNTTPGPTESKNIDDNRVAFTSKQKTILPEPTKDEVIKPIETHKPNFETNNSVNPYAKLWSYQLIGVSTPQSAVNFVKNNKLNRDDILIIKSIRADMDWWVVLYGLYKDKQTGADNQSNLPSGIQKPWLRSLKNLVINGYIEKY